MKSTNKKTRKRGLPIHTLFIFCCVGYATIFFATLMTSDVHRSLKAEDTIKSTRSAHFLPRENKNLPPTKQEPPKIVSKTTDADRKEEINDKQVNEEPKSPPKHHIVFSTDCSSYQRWQSYLLFYFAMKHEQDGTVTRIASGCTDDEAREEIEYHKKYITSQMSDRFQLHLTPEFSTVVDEEGQNTGKKYSFFNKPFGLLHFLDEHKPKEVKSDPHSPGKMIDDDDIIVLIDPDQIQTRPINSDFSNRSQNYFVEGNADKWELKTKVTHGSPLAQKFGFNNAWQRLDIAKIAGPKSPALDVTAADARNHYPAGPPYLATARDMHLIASHWAEFVPKVYAEHPHLMAEMYAYCIAAAHVKLPHQILTSLMISDSSSGSGGEGWNLIEKISDDDLCNPSVVDDVELPLVLHFCQRYMVGRYFFGKRRMPTNIFSCEMPLLKEPPQNLPFLYDYFTPPKPHPVTEEKPFKHKYQNRYESFMICFLSRAVNEASAFYKKNNCEGNTKSSDERFDLWESK